MNLRLILAVALPIVLSAPAVAEPARFPVTLPHCPTPLVLSAPGAFAGAQNEQHVLDHMAANTARKGTYVLSLTAPAAPHIHLLVLELGTTKEIQGRVSQGQFNELRDYLLQQDLATLAKNQEYAKALAAGAKTPYEVKGPNIYRVSGSDREAVVLAITRGATNDLDVVSYSASKFIYAQNCIAHVSMFAPVSSMPIDAFEALVPDLSVE